MVLSGIAQRRTLNLVFYLSEVWAKYVPNVLEVHVLYFSTPTKHCGLKKTPLQCTEPDSNKKCQMDARCDRCNVAAVALTLGKLESSGNFIK